MASTRVDNHIILSCKFSPRRDGAVSCTASTSEALYGTGPGTLNVYHYNKTQQLDLINSFVWSQALLDSCWSTAQEDVLVTSGGDGSLQLWHVFNPDSKAAGPSALFVGHQGAATNVLWKPEVPNKVISGSVDTSLKIWDAEQQKAIQTYCLNDAVLQVSYNSLVPGLVAVVLANRQLLLLDDRCPIDKSQPKLISSEQVLSCDWSPSDGNLLVTASPKGCLECLDLRFVGEQRVGQVASHRGPVRRVRWMPAYRHIVLSAGFDGKTVLTDIWTGEVLERISHHSNIVHDVDCSLFHSQLIVDCSWDSLLHVFEPLSLIRQSSVVTQPPLTNKL